MSYELIGVESVSEKKLKEMSNELKKRYEETDLVKEICGIQATNF